MEIATFIANLFVSTLAIGLSVYFYTQSKNAEINAQTALKGIETQANMLQTLNTQITTRLVKSVTSPRDESSAALQFTSLLRDLPDFVLKLRIPTDTTSQA